MYSIANLVSIPINFTRQCLIRLTLGFRVITCDLHHRRPHRDGCHYSDFVRISRRFQRVRQIASGRINRAAVVYGFFGFPVVAICVMVLLQFGFFDTMLSRFEYDAGSASTRQVALDLVSNMPSR